MNFVRVPLGSTTEKRRQRNTNGEKKEMECDAVTQKLQ